jgi:uncharacterized tellurite resistance protein B-like protein
MKHPALALEQPLRVAYVSTVASIVFADEDVAEEELAIVRQLCSGLELTGEGTAQVLEAIKPAAELASHHVYEQLREAGLGVPLVTDAIIVAFADGRLSPGETKGLVAVAHLVGVTTAQCALIARFVDTQVGDPDEAGALAAELTAALAVHGVPAHGPHPIRWLHEHLARKTPTVG